MNNQPIQPVYLPVFTYEDIVQAFHMFEGAFFESMNEVSTLLEEAHSESIKLLESRATIGRQKQVLEVFVPGLDNPGSLEHLRRGIQRLEELRLELELRVRRLDQIFAQIYQTRQEHRGIWEQCYVRFIHEAERHEDVDQTPFVDVRLSFIRSVNMMYEAQDIVADLLRGTLVGPNGVNRFLRDELLAGVERRNRLIGDTVVTAAGAGPTLETSQALARAVSFVEAIRGFTERASQGMPEAAEATRGLRGIFRFHP